MTELRKFKIRIGVPVQTPTRLFYARPVDATRSEPPDETLKTEASRCAGPDARWKGLIRESDCHRCWKWHIQFAGDTGRDPSPTRSPNAPKRSVSTRWNKQDGAQTADQTLIAPQERCSPS